MSMQAEVERPSGESSSSRSVPAWSLWTAIVVVAFIALIVRLVNLSPLLDRLSGPHWWAEVFWWNVLVPLAVLAFSTVGAMVLSRDPANRLGWLLLLLAAMATIHDLAWQYAVRSTYLASESLPGENLATWLAHAVMPSILVLTYGVVLLHFPDGRLASRRWKWVIWYAVLIAGLNAVNSVFWIVTGGSVNLQRPSALTVDFSDGVTGWIHALIEFGTVGLILLAIASIFARWRGATGIERLRLKWLGFAGAIVVLSLTVCTVSITLSSDSYITMSLLSVNLTVFTVGVPVAIGIAILRYQLFDIDIVINRTLVYSLIMLVLGACYALSVLVLQSILGSLAGSSGIAVAASTLVVVALFQPLRSRVQTGVDRRFYRTRYDASLALTRFGHAIHDEIDLDRLQLILADLITETMRPHCVTIWLPATDGEPFRKRRVGHVD